MDAGFDDSPETIFTRVLSNSPPRALRAVPGGVELYVPESDTRLRQYLRDTPATAWAHVRGDRWWVAYQGGEVLEVDFEAQTATPVARFGGDVYWFDLEHDGLETRIRLAIADHSLEGVGSFRMLYGPDPHARGAATVLGGEFGRVFVDEYRRVWLLPKPGDGLQQLQYVDIGSGRVVPLDVPDLDRRGQKRYGGVLPIPDGPLLVWGFHAGGGGSQVSWAAELAPPFVDTAWSEVATFRSRGLPVVREPDARLVSKIERGEVTLRYDETLGMVWFLDDSIDTGWRALPSMGAWVREEDWPALFIRGHDSLPEVLRGSRADRLQTDDFAGMPEGWPDDFLDPLHSEPAQSAGRLDPEREEDPLLAAMLRDVRGLLSVVDTPNAVIAVGADGLWVGLGSGKIATLDPDTGRYKEVGSVFGIPSSIECREHDGEAFVEVVFWPFMASDSRPRETVFRQQPGLGLWRSGPEHAIEDPRPDIWSDRRVARLWQHGQGWTAVEWEDMATADQVRTIDREDEFKIVGLIELPDGRVIGYGSDLRADSPGPVLVDVVRGRDGILWSRSVGHLCEQSPLPEGGITRAAYIPQARRLLLVADDTVWSTGLGFRDWRQELPAMPE